MQVRVVEEVSELEDNLRHVLEDLTAILKDDLVNHCHQHYLLLDSWVIKHIDSQVH